MFTSITMFDPGSFLMFPSSLVPPIIPSPSSVAGLPTSCTDLSTSAASSVENDVDTLALTALALKCALPAKALTKTRNKSFGGLKFFQPRNPLWAAKGREGRSVTEELWSLVSEPRAGPLDALLEIVETDENAPNEIRQCLQAGTINPCCKAIARNAAGIFTHFS